MPISHGSLEPLRLGRVTGRFISASVALFAASTVLSGPSHAGNVAPGDTVTVGAGDTAETWDIQNDATLNVTVGGMIQQTGVFGTLNMSGATATPTAAPSGYTINVFGGKANIVNSTITGPGGLGVSGFFGVPGSAAVTDSAIEGTSQAVLVQHGSTLDMTGGTVKGGTHGFELINGSDVTIDGTTITSGGVGIQAYAGISPGAVGSTVTVKNSNIETTGIAVDISEGSTANLRDTKISTTATDAHGLYARSSGVINAERVDVTTSGERAYGAYAVGTDTRIDLHGGSYTTSGFAAHGVVATNMATLTIGRDPASGAGTLIQTTGDSAVGVYAGAGSAVTVDGATIRTEGGGTVSWAMGVFAIGGSAIDMTDTKIETTGFRGSGMNVRDDGSHVNMVRGSINVTGALSGDGATAFAGGKITLTDVTVSADDGRGVVAGDGTSSLTMTGGSVTTKGDGVGNSAAFAVRGARVDLNGVDARTEGNDAIGLHAFNSGSTVNAVGSAITTHGAGSHGGFASGGGSVAVTNSNVITEGTGSHGLVAQNDSSVAATGSVIKTTGADSAGVYLLNDSSADLDKTSVVSEKGPALQTAGGSVVFDLKNGTQAIGGNGTVLTAASGTTTTLTADGKSYLGGDMVAEADDAVIDASLSNGSLWQGAAKGLTSASVDGTSHWLMTGSSDVGSLTNDGTVEFDAANPYKTLTAATLNVNGGSFILNTKLNEGGAASETDKIAVTGDANGIGMINIRNNGGTGAFTGTGTADGIQVVQIGGASDAEFQLGSAAVVGIYDYQLKKADGQNWYLQTEGNDVVDPGDGSGGNPGTGHVVDIVPGYNIALSAAQNHVLTTLDTFHERLGELRSEDLQDGFHAWMRGIGKTGSYSPKSITGYNGHGFDMTTAGVQIGADYSKGDVFVAGDKLTVGIFGEYANSSFDVRGRTADGSISSKGLGGYVTWQEKAPTDRKLGAGAYVDAVVKHDWLDFGVNAKSVSGFDLRNGYKGKATSASIETGYGFDLGNNVVLQPQAQLTYSKIRADGFTDNYGIAVHGQEAESLIGRVGVRLEKTFYFGDEEEMFEVAPAKPIKPANSAKGKKGAKAKTVIVPLPETPKKKKFVKSVTTFADANAKHEFKGKNGLVASGTGIGNDMGGTRYDVGVGVVARVSENVSLFGRGAVEFGGSTNVAGKVSGGLKITWK
ncbi:autotransporter outer membrane beta-barrel domain-containing protein [Brucella sp. HL-2]|nr:autotransporter outer membrane beta-barrel domain-containing protein [Brucella sp. HL-2]MCV9908512.1 autotransporter outer membrane beta-barrel domain-containing protein [Brucella sp. HL-2]